MGDPHFVFFTHQRDQKTDQEPDSQGACQQYGEGPGARNCVGM
jgi:hypothetical protein